MIQTAVPPWLTVILIASGLITFLFLAAFVYQWLRSELHIRRLARLWESQARIGITPSEEGGPRHAQRLDGPGTRRRPDLYDGSADFGVPDRGPHAAVDPQGSHRGMEGGRS